MASNPPASYPYVFMAEQKDEQEIRFIIGIIGVIFSACMNISQTLLLILDIYKKRPVINYNETYHVAMIVKCSLWLLYGLPYVSSNNKLVTIMYSMSLLLEMINVSIFYVCSMENRKKDRLTTSLPWLFASVAFFYSIMLNVVPSMKIRSPIVGVVSNLWTVGLGIYLWYYGVLSPWISLMDVITGCIWLAYACIGKIDIHLLVSNAVVAFCCAIRLLCHLVYVIEASFNVNRIKLYNFLGTSFHRFSPNGDGTVRREIELREII